ncbi:MAG: HAMP domain-containing protein, partial [Magnetospirillum sp.]
MSRRSTAPPASSRVRWMPAWHRPAASRSTPCARATEPMRREAFPHRGEASSSLFIPCLSPTAPGGRRRTCPDEEAHVSHPSPRRLLRHHRPARGLRRRRYHHRRRQGQSALMATNRGRRLMSFGNVRISAKILLVVALCSLVTIAVALTGSLGIVRLSDSLSTIESTSRTAMAATKLNQLALTLNRTEYILAADPTPDNLRETGKRIEAERRDLTAALDRLKGLTGTGQTDLLKDIVTGQAAYLASQNDTIAKVKEHGASVEVSEGQMIITEAAMTSSTVAGRFERAVQAYTAHAEADAAVIFEHAATVRSTAQTAMLAVAILGTVGGFVAGALLGHLGISKPLGASVDCLRRLAEGDTELSVYGRDRRDEIGAIAATLEVFRANMLRNRAMEADAAAAARKAAADKAEAMRGLADSLESTVADVVATLSSASEAMRTKSQSMSSMSKAASAQAVTVACAARNASGNVESVASAAEEMTASIAEISRRVTHA